MATIDTRSAPTPTPLHTHPQFLDELSLLRAQLVDAMQDYLVAQRKNMLAIVVAKTNIRILSLRYVAALQRRTTFDKRYDKLHSESKNDQSYWEKLAAKHAYSAYLHAATLDRSKSTSKQHYYQDLVSLQAKAERYLTLCQIPVLGAIVRALFGPPVLEQIKAHGLAVFAQMVSNDPSQAGIEDWETVEQLSVTALRDHQLETITAESPLQIVPFEGNVLPQDESKGQKDKPSSPQAESKDLELDDSTVRHLSSLYTIQLMALSNMALSRSEQSSDEVATSKKVQEHRWSRKIIDDAEIRTQALNEIETITPKQHQAAFKIAKATLQAGRRIINVTPTAETNMKQFKVEVDSAIERAYVQVPGLWESDFSEASSPEQRGQPKSPPMFDVPLSSRDSVAEPTPPVKVPHPAIIERKGGGDGAMTPWANKNQKPSMSDEELFKDFDETLTDLENKNDNTSNRH